MRTTGARVTAVTLLACFTAAASSFTVGSLPFGHARWTTDTVIVTSSLTIENGDTLTINPGTRVLFQGHFKMKVYGSIFAEGTGADTILFTVTDTAGLGDTSRTAGAWHGIRFYGNGMAVPSSKARSVLRHCELRYSKAVVDGDDEADDMTDDGGGARSTQGGAVYVKKYNGLTIDSCFIHHSVAANDAAVFVDSSSGNITANIIAYNVSYKNAAGIRCSNKANPTIAFNHIHDNYSYGQGGALYCMGNSNPLVKHNVIERNTTWGCGGAIMCYQYSSPYIVNNEMYDNRAMHGGAIRCWTSCNPAIVGNAIKGNRADTIGGGIYCSGSCSPLVANNTIVNNSAYIGGGICVRGATAAMQDSTGIYNTILWGNTALSSGNQVYMYDSVQPAFFHCDIQGGVAAFGVATAIPLRAREFGCIDADPLLTDSAGWAFNLRGGSPCVDAGTPDTSGLALAGGTVTLSERVWDGNGDQVARIDIGAVEYGAPPNRSAVINPRQKRPRPQASAARGKVATGIVCYSSQGRLLDGTRGFPAGIVIAFDQRTPRRVLAALRPR